MRPYLDLLDHVLTHGHPSDDRTGTGTLSVFGAQMRWDLAQGFPAVTTKRLAFRLVVSELLWFLRGETNIRSLLADHNPIWTDWPYARYRQSAAYDGSSMETFAQRILDDPAFAQQWGDLGPIYGHQWRHWTNADGSVVDQIAQVIDQIRTHPTSRRHLVVAYHPGEVDQMALPPCHTLFQFDVRQGRLSCQLTQRSGDLFLGVPFNIASYALLTSMIAQVTGLQVGEFIHTLGNAHIYTTHFSAVRTQLARTPLPLPRLWLNPEITDIDAFTAADIRLEGYRHHPAIFAPVSV